MSAPRESAGRAREESLAGDCERIRVMFEARLENLAEGINERSWDAGTRKNPLLRF